MGHFENTVRKYFGIVLLVIAVTCGGCKDKTQPQGNAATNSAPGTPAPADSRELSVDDVSLLFPAPVTAADMSNLIAVADLTAPNPQDSSKHDPVWSAAAFQQFVGIANSKVSQVTGTQAQIGLPTEAQNVSAWFIAGIRIDAGAPGLTDDIRTQFGRLPQIRLIVQPVTRAADGTPKVLDIAGHLIYDFTLPTETNPPQPECFRCGRPIPMRSTRFSSTSPRCAISCATANSAAKRSAPLVCVSAFIPVWPIRLLRLLFVARSYPSCKSIFREIVLMAWPSPHFRAVLRRPGFFCPCSRCPKVLFLLCRMVALFHYMGQPSTAAISNSPNCCNPLLRFRA